MVRDEIIQNEAFCFSIPMLLQVDLALEYQGKSGYLSGISLSST